MTSFSPFLRYQPLVDDWAAFSAALLRPLPTCVWANPLRVTPADLAQIFRAEGIPFEPVAWYPGGFKLAPEFRPSGHWAYLAGLYHVQEEVSLLPVTLLNPQPGERVLDLCAAPGGKTAQIAVKMGNRGTVVANDVNFGRMRGARHTLERLGLVNVCTTVCNGANYPAAAGRFDRVLVDAPCSCEGTSRKEPGVLARVGEPVSRQKSGLQRALLRRAVRLCRPGGRIVYSTCTYAPEENELVLDAILQEFGDAVSVAAVTPTGLMAGAGVVSWQGQALHPAVRHALRLWPHHNDTGGFFVAALDKKAGLAASEADLPGGVDFSPIPAEIMELAVSRFGFLPADLARYAFFQRSSRQTHLANPDQQPPVTPEPDAVGLQFMRTAIKDPKLNTSAALLLGPLARQNVIDLTPAQVTAFINRQDFELPAAQAQHCVGQGYVLARHRGFGLGVGVFWPRAGGGGVVRSLFPKSWSPGGGQSGE